jgi:hypothetical protein
VAKGGGPGNGATPIGRPPRAISDSPEDRQEVPDARAVATASVWVTEVSGIPADAVCCVCGQGNDLWTLDEPGGRARWIHEECYAGWRPAEGDKSTRSDLTA